MGCEIIDNTLKRWFYHFGFYIGKHPGYFIIVPLLLTALCVSGFQRMNYVHDSEYLFSPTDGEAKTERAIMEKHFPTNYSQFQSSRTTRAGRFARILVTPKDGGSMLRVNMWNQLLYLDQVRPFSYDFYFQMFFFFFLFYIV